MDKAKFLYFFVFIVVVTAFIFHATAMGHHHWKKAIYRENIAYIGTNEITFGLFTRCQPSNSSKTETCEPNLYPTSGNCSNYTLCLLRNDSRICDCDFLPSSKGIASCTIIAAIFLGTALVLLFFQSINTSETRPIRFVLGMIPFICLLFAWLFMLVALILVGTYLKRDMMHIVRSPSGDENLDDWRNRVDASYDVQIDWSSGLEIIALVLTFLAFILYAVFVFVLG